MKKMVAWLMAGCMIVSLCACGGKSDKVPEPKEEEKKIELPQTLRAGKLTMNLPEEFEVGYEDSTSAEAQYLKTVNNTLKFGYANIGTTTFWIDSTVDDEMDEILEALGLENIEDIEPLTYPGEAKQIRAVAGKGTADASGIEITAWGYVNVITFDDTMAVVGIILSEEGNEVPQAMLNSIHFDPDYEEPTNTKEEEELDVEETFKKINDWCLEYSAFLDEWEQNDGMEYKIRYNKYDSEYWTMNDLLVAIPYNKMTSAQSMESFGIMELMSDVWERGHEIAEAKG